LQYVIDTKQQIGGPSQQERDSQVDLGILYESWNAAGTWISFPPQGSWNFGTMDWESPEAKGILCFDCQGLTWQRLDCGDELHAKKMNTICSFCAVLLSFSSFSFPFKQSG
jgi:hypothetical protein